ncbi:MAG: type I pullulanase [Bacilli bacterium]|nr:type I pullulanase [Bacilli bacterium]
MNTYLRAKLINWRKINVIVFTDIPRPESFRVLVYKNNKVIKKETISRLHSTNIIYFFDISLDEDYELGASYRLLVGTLPYASIDISDVVDFNDFDARFAYNGDDLGSIYTKEATSFAVWAPLAESVSLELFDLNNNRQVIEMKRTDKGVYRYKALGNLLNYKYHYIVNNNGIIYTVNDPYAKGTSLNSEHSVVINYDALLKLPKIKPTNVINNYVDALIYETHIRDINEGNNNNVINKGTYLGFVEEGRTTEGGHPVGLDYLKYLGITHVQIQPILDFNSLDDKDTKKWYNWGYDPISFFALEGSFSLKPEDAIERLYEFKEMVDKLHKNNIRVVVDVVYNHIYEYENSVLEKLVPHYYFRKRRNGVISNASGCGNDFASERIMARKMILDSVSYLFKYFDIDGLRFDLMGLLDIETVKQTYNIAKAIKDDVIFYGEGWNMGDELPANLRANKNNYKELKEIGFFNDSYRDIVKGPSSPFNLHEKGYICGNTSYQFGLDYAFHAGVLKLSYEPMFDNANQSINYLECHDNNTLYDKLIVSNADEEEKTLLDRVMLGNSILLLSFGVPLIHMGQEIGLSKDGLDNTYKTLGVNNMDYRLVDERFDMVNRFRLMNSLRRKLGYLKLFNKEDLKDFFEISHWDNGVYVLIARNKNIICQEKEFVLLINPTSNAVSFELDDYYTVLEGVKDEQSINVKNGFLPACNLMILFKK